MVKQSIIEATNRFVNIAFEENPNIEDYGDFKSALISAFNTKRGRNATGQFSDEAVIGFFESEETRRKLRENLTDEEYEKIYGDGDLVIREAIIPKKITTITTPRIKVKSYTTKRGITPKAYSRGKGVRWTLAQTRFVQTRKQKKISPKQIIREYTEHFKANPRSSSSISTKLYRI